MKMDVESKAEQNPCCQIVVAGALDAAWGSVVQ